MVPTVLWKGHMPFRGLGNPGLKEPPTEQIFLYSVVKTSVSFDPLNDTIGASSNRKYIQELFYDL